MGVRPSFPSCPVDVSGTAPCNAPLCGPWFRDTSGGGHAIGSADLAIPVTHDADVGGGCGLGGCGIVDVVEDGSAAVVAGRVDGADDVLGCDGTEEGGAAVDTG